MALTVHIYYSGENDNAEKFTEEMTALGIVNAIREKKGNLQYEYFYSKENPQTVLLIDSWENQNAIDMHHASPMMAEIIRLREKYNLHMRVERFVSAGEIPDSDKVFIKE